MTGALVRRGKSGHTCEDGGRGGARSYAPRIANNHRRRDTGLQRILPQSLQQELTSDTLVSDLWPPQLRERISVVLSPPVCGVLLQQPWGLIHAAALSVFLPPPDSTGASGSHRWRHTSIFAEGSIGQFRSTLRTLLGERSKDGQFGFQKKSTLVGLAQSHLPYRPYSQSRSFHREGLRHCQGETRGTEWLSSLT